MNRLLRVVPALTLVVSVSAFAQGARIAVHPLDARELTVEQREWLRAFFDVRLARTNGIQLAGSSRVEDALRSPKAKDCETKDGCLRHLAEATDSLYAVYARLRREPLGGELMMTARVVRADGTVMKTVSRRAQPEKNVELLETCRTLVFNTVEALELRALPDTIPSAPSVPSGDLFAALPPPPLLTAEASTVKPGMSLRRKAGLGIASLGVGTIVAGSVLFGLAADGRNRLSPDSSGAVPPSQAAAASTVAGQARASTALIPIGALLAGAGAVLFLLPEGPLNFSLAAGPSGGGVTVGAALP